MWSGYNLLANLATWRKLPDDVRGSIERNAVKYVALQRADNTALNDQLQGALAMRGMIFNTTDTSGFRPPLADFYRRWKEHFGPKAWAMLEGHVGKLG
jgi:TRAP-type C4-dicarboxylate transport system substrate-binding protein